MEYWVRPDCDTSIIDNQGYIMPKIEEITVENAKSNLETSSACFVDIRDADSYSAGHVEGAFSLNDSNIGLFMSETDKSKTHIIYCYHGNSSKQATEFFMNNGFDSVYSMAGGYEAWASS